MIEEERVLPYHPGSLLGNRVLAVAPHPDDEIIGCGGSLILHVRRGDPVRVVYLTRGDKGDFAGKYGDEYPAIREAEAREAARRVGVTDLTFLPYKDRRVRAEGPLVGDLARAIESSQATLIYCPAPTEAQPDHVQAALAVWEAAVRANRPLKVAFYETTVPLKPNLLVDISDVIELKMDTLRCHRTQLEDIDWSDRVRGLHKFRTISLLGQAEYAEAFLVADVAPGRARSLEDVYRTLCGMEAVEGIGAGRWFEPAWRVRIPLPKGRLRIERDRERKGS